MNEQDNQTPPPTMKLADIYFVVFRHLRLIALFSGLGVLAALFLFLTRQPLYESVAKVMVHYVLEPQVVGPDAEKARMLSVDSRGETIMGAEREILTSMDLARSVVQDLGPSRVLRKAGGGTNQLYAIEQIMKNLEVEILNKGNVLKITYRNPDPEMAQLVLSQLITNYHNKHLTVYQRLGSNDDFFRQKQIAADELRRIEDQLADTKARSMAFSPEEDKRALNQQMWKVRGEIDETAAKLAELSALDPSSAGNKLQSNNVPASVGEASAVELAEYQDLVKELASVRSRQQQLLVQQFYTPSNSVMLALRAKIQDLQKRRTQMEEANPRLAILAAPSLQPSSSSNDVAVGLSDVAALKAHLGVLTNQLLRLQTNAVDLDKAERAILELQRNKELQETNYRYFTMRVDQSRTEDQLAAGKISNITPVQDPSFPLRSPGKTKKMMAMALAGGILGGIGLAFLLELFLDQTVKRPEEVEKKLRLPLVLTIPELTNGSKRPWLPGLKWLASSDSRLRHSHNGHNGSSTLAGTPADGHGNSALTPTSQSQKVAQGLTLYYAALRDRLTTYFEVRNMTRKPKLVGVTSCGEGAGVTTVAAGLASVLSETGDGRVLLVDMSAGGTAVHPFYKGKPGCGLGEALEQEKRETALVQENLYLVKAGDTSSDSKLPLNLSKRFLSLMPKFKASDYDYILFDMPPVGQTSATPRLAGMMDIVLLVLEAEKTQQEAVSRAQTLLRDSKTNVAAVLNKRRTYVPALLQQEL